MIHDEEYERMRAAFTELCVKRAPKVLEAEVRASAPREFDELCGHPKVRHVAVAEDGLICVTSELVMDGDCGPFWAGQFAIKLSADKSIACRSLSREATAYQHPHVAGTSFTPCLFQNKPIIDKLCGDGNLGQLALLMVEFLQLYNSMKAYPSAWGSWTALTPEEIAEWKNAT